jgi:hypothetical protein
MGIEKSHKLLPLFGEGTTMARKKRRTVAELTDAVEAGEGGDLVAHITLRDGDGRLVARGEVPVELGAVDLSRLELEAAEGEGEGAEGE